MLVSRNSGSVRAQVESLESRQLLSVSSLSAVAEFLAARTSHTVETPHIVHSATSKPPVLDVENADFLPFSDRMIFNAIKYQNVKVGDTTHTIGTLLIRNAGGSPLTIKSFTISAGSPWILMNAPKTPFTLAPGASFSLKVKFTATSDPKHTDNQTNDTHTTNLVSVTNAGGVWNGTLTIATNDPVTSSKVVTLAGYWQFQSEHENEPGLQTILNKLGGWTTVISSTQVPDLVEGNSPVYYGEELKKAFFWQAADPTKPVVVRAVAMFHNQGNSSAIAWYAKGKTTNTKIFTTAPDESQSVLPHLLGSTTLYAAGTFKPGATVFGWKLDGEYSDDTRNLATAGKGGGHHVRAYPVRDRNGKIEPNNYFLAMDYSDTNFENYDFQDTVFYVENIKPAT